MCNPRIVCWHGLHTRIFLKTYPKYPKLPWTGKISYSKARLLSSPCSHVLILYLFPCVNQFPCVNRFPWVLLWKKWYISELNIVIKDSNVLYVRRYFSQNITSWSISGNCTGKISSLWLAKSATSPTLQ